MKKNPEEIQTTKLLPVFVLISYTDPVNIRLIWPLQHFIWNGFLFYILDYYPEEASGKL
ncbi:MAG: hypothetical protein ACLS36_05895 [Streptococcus sp.]